MSRYTIIAWAMMLMTVQTAVAVSGRNPTGVNVNATGPTSVFITFQGTAGQSSSDAFWCGELIAPIPANGVFVGTNPCVPGTLFGHLPRRLDRSRSSGVNVTNLTDIMTIPASVSRRAYQAAANGANSAFFYVRRFTGNGPDEYVVVTCRMAGGGARVPFALIKVVPYFVTDSGKTPVRLLAIGQQPPAVAATLYYNGSGRLKGRWEVVRPGDPEPEAFDLLPEASLPVEQRGLQQQYTVIGRFNRFLPPTGRVTLPGPNPDRIPVDVHGPYKLLLRIEATADKEGNSKTAEGLAVSGGVAGFPMPVLRYFVATADEIAAARQGGGTIRLLSPEAEAKLEFGVPLEFRWAGGAGAAFYRLEIVDATGNEVLAAMIRGGQYSYVPPPWLFESASGALQWRLTALGDDGRQLGSSEWRVIFPAGQY